MKYSQEQKTMTKFLNAPTLSIILNLNLFNLRRHKLKYVQDYAIQMSFKCRTNFNIFWYMYFLLLDHSTIFIQTILLVSYTSFQY